uniref:Uncharacterized protein n=1 Tax=Ralstonia solanacearum TaxID=305 RepID=A0A0S4WPI8_RALSL|nr:protein of unknown function [Ralstonia solanacearum]
MGSEMFFRKKKTAYEIMPSLVGSEMCIRDSSATAQTRDLREDRKSVLDDILKAVDLGEEAVSYTHLTLPTKA